MTSCITTTWPRPASTSHTIVRVNRQGDIEVRRPTGWDVIGGLLGEFDERIRRETGLDWAE